MKHEQLVDDAVKDIKALRKENAKLRRRYKKHVVFVASFIELMDVVMRAPADVNRGKKVAELLNKLDVQNDCAWHFDLGFSLEKKKK